MSRFIRKIWKFGSGIIPNYYKHFLKMDIGNNVVIARTALLDRNVNPRGIHIGDNTWVLRNATILAHDHCRSLDVNKGLFDTVIGNNCIIGINSIILPGIKVSDHCVVAAGAVVTKNTPPHTILAGNPAKVIKTGIQVNNQGQIIDRGEIIDV